MIREGLTTIRVMDITLVAQSGLDLLDYSQAKEMRLEDFYPSTGAIYRCRGIIDATSLNWKDAIEHQIGLGILETCKAAKVHYRQQGVAWNDYIVVITNREVDWMVEIYTELYVKDRYENQATKDHN
jgi:hypothetical protein